jgi:eukaryotic-like serine/threonine-protein kinase
LSLSPGQAFGNYRILSRVGVGGMGMVFLAEHPHIGKRVALKIIHRDLAGHEEVVERFLNEARAVNHIGSDHIVQIHDFGQTEGGEHFFIMEYLDGRTLAQALDGGPLEVGRALHIGAQIAGALTAAHEVDIIHRDLKPDNVMLIRRLGDDDFVKLLDFGLAKFVSEADARKLTAAGVVLGTPHYMSPEACESKPNVDHRCDVYSLGVLLFQMTTGQLPFTGGTMGEVLIKQVVQPPPPPRSLNHSLPPAVEQVILRCLAKNPAARFQRMRELRDALVDLGRQAASAPTIDPDSADTILVDDGLSVPGARGSGATAMLKSSQPTELEVGSGGRWLGGADAPTAYMDEAAHRQYGGYAGSVAHGGSQARAGDHAALLPHDSQPGAAQAKRTWPMVVAILLAGVAAGVVAFLIARPDSTAPVLAGKTVAPQPTVARIRLTTSPSGAEVSDERGNHLGITPTDLALPIGREVLLRFHHAGTIDSKKKVLPTRDVALHIELPPRPAPERQASEGEAPDDQASEDESKERATKASAKRDESSSARKSRKSARRKAQKRRAAKAKRSEDRREDKPEKSEDRADRKFDDELLRPEI